jgi:hypothetical protein
MLKREPFGNGSDALDAASALWQCIDAVAPQFEQAEKA